MEELLLLEDDPLPLTGRAEDTTHDLHHTLTPQHKRHGDTGAPSTAPQPKRPR